MNRSLRVRITGLRLLIALSALSGLVAMSMPAPARQPVAPKPSSHQDRAERGEPQRARQIRTSDRPIRLRGKSLATMRTNHDIEQSVRRAKRDGTRIILQLDGPITPDQRAELRAVGVRLGDYLPENAFFADLTNADAQQLKSLEFVRWHAPVDAKWKREPALGTRAHTTPERRAIAAAGRIPLIVTLFPGADAEALAQAVRRMPRAPQVHYTDELAGSPFLVVTIDIAQVDELTRLADVQFIEETPELTDRSNKNDRWIVQSNVPASTPFNDVGLRGEDQIIGVIDGSTGGLDMGHCSFIDLVNNTPGPAHRKVLAYNSALGVLAHATHVAGTAAGDNGADDDTRGVAWAAKLVYAPRPVYTQTGIYNALTLHHTQGARIHTNSWGDDSVAWYTSLCRGIDSFAYDNEDDLVCFAVTNTGTLRTPENSKNALAVGASQGSPNQGAFCSGGIGPTADGRRKPEVFAPGCSTVSAASSSGCGLVALSGTSMASPAVAGAATLARQYFVTGFFPSGAANPGDSMVPSGALLKAVLANSAVDMTLIAGFPSDQEGWGRVLLDNALYLAGDTNRLILRDVRNATGLFTGELAVVGVTVASAAHPLKVTLAWTEPPAALGADLVQVNNLDLEVISPAGQVYRGNAFSAGQSAAGGTPDSANNLEQVLLSLPSPGQWSVRVRGQAINVGAQGYALVITGDVSESPAPLAVFMQPTPDSAAPGVAVNVQVRIDPGADSLTPGSPMLHYRAAPGAFTSIPLTSIGGDLFQATLPGSACGQSIEMYASATGASSGSVNDPSDQPASLRSMTIGDSSTPLFDDFETDNGWTVGALGDTATTGQWVRVDPIGTSAQPEDDHSTDPGTLCWITGQHVIGQTDGFADVDGGSTTLLSPIFDLSATPAPTISYARWFYTNSAGIEDSLRVDISHDGGATWFPVETIGTVPPRLQALGGWFVHSFDPALIVPSLTANMRMRFVANDAAPGTIVEAGIDDFTITSFACVTPPPFCIGDANGDLIVNFDDITALLANWGASYTPGSAGLGDANNDGIVDFDDVTTVLANWGADCN